MSCSLKFIPVRYACTPVERYDCPFAAAECVTLHREKFANVQAHGDSNRDEVALQWVFFAFLSIF